jgi:ribosomal protein L11 methyltransferase
MDTIQISIEVGEEQQEVLISTLTELGAEGFEQTDRLLIAYFPALDFNSYEIHAALENYTFHTLTLEEQNWNAIWESNFQPVNVGDFCTVRADFHEPVPGTQHEIIITPKMSFGTGHHATTYMMIEQMENIDCKNKRLFDFGTGTGILAILAEKLGAAHITAIDVDEWSITNAKENFERNSCSKIRVVQSTLIPPEQFDIILANINRNVILNYLAELIKALTPGGYMLLSGLLTTDEETVLSAASGLGLILRTRIERNNWLSVLLQRALE